MSTNRICIALVLLLATACTLTSQPPTTPSPALVIPTLTPFVAPPATQEASIPQDEAASESANVSVASNPPAAASAACTPRTDWPLYAVVRGDTLASLARRTGSTVAALTTANCLADANVISVGQSLRLPAIPAPPSTTALVAQACTAAVIVPATNLYSGPGNSYSVVSTIAGADTLIVVGHTDHRWYQVTYPGAASAWIDGTTISLTGNCAALPNQTMTAVSQTCTATVIVPATNLYSGPGDTYSVVSTIAGADTLIVVGHTDHRWYQVTYPGAASAWIDGTTISLTGNCAALP